MDGGVGRHGPPARERVASFPYGSLAVEAWARDGTPSPEPLPFLHCPSALSLSPDVWPPPLLPLSPIELEDGAGSVVGMTIVTNELDLAPLTTKKLVFMTKR
jgi:hypothetical protein